MTPSDAATDGSAALAPDPVHKVSGEQREIVWRVAAALVMAPLGLWVVYLGGWALIVATSLCAALGAVEWTRMALSGARLPVRLVFNFILIGGGVLATVGGAAGLAWAGMAAVVSAALAAAASLALRTSPLSMAFGAAYISLPFGAFVWLRESQPDGRMILFALLGIVWATDIAAYFAGRGFGGPLLSPKDSPNKTWNGAIGAVICAALAAAAVARAGEADMQGWIVIGLAMSIVAQAGDLLESRCKRVFGVKDSSGIIPGHGGVLDRLDALMAASVGLAILVQFFPGLAPDFPAGGPQ